jgi:hypothetical protein
MELGSLPTKSDVEKVTASRDTGGMQRLRDISNEMRHPFQRIRAGEIRAT